MNRIAREWATFNSAVIPAAEPRSIAVFQALNLGDLLCATPALRAIRRRFPTAVITLIGREWAGELVERLPAVDRFFPFPGFAGIAESPVVMATPATTPHCDLAIQMHGSGDQSNGYVSSLGATRSVGYGPPGDTRLTVRLDWLENEPEPLRWLRLVATVGAVADGLHLDFPTTMQERQMASALLGPADGRPLIGLHAGASDPGRRWPAESYAALADSLVKQLDARIVLTGSSQERQLTAAVRGAMATPAIDLSGETTLGQFAAVIAALDLLVTNDTSASHIAAATRTRSVVLFGPTRPDRWAPLDLTMHHIIDATAAARGGLNGTAALQALPAAFVARRCRTALREAQIVNNRHFALERTARA